MGTRRLAYGLCGIALSAWTAGPVHAAATPADAGARVFQQTCAGCHHGGPASLRTAPQQVANVLRAGTVRRHRFTLTEERLRALTDYLSARPAVTR